MFKYFEFFRLYVLFDFFTHVVFHVFNFAKILQVTSDALTVYSVTDARKYLQ